MTQFKIIDLWILLLKKAVESIHRNTVNLTKQEKEENQ